MYTEGGNDLAGSLDMKVRGRGLNFRQMVVS